MLNDSPMPEVVHVSYVVENLRANERYVMQVHTVLYDISTELGVY